MASPPGSRRLPFRSRRKETNLKGKLELRGSTDQRFEFLVDQILGQNVPLLGTDWTLDGLKFLPDFRLEGKEAVSASEQPNNPALVFEISGGSGTSALKSSADCDHAEGECNHEEQKACCPKPGETKASPHAAPFSSGLTLFFAADGKLRFASSAQGQRTAAGDVDIGKGIPVGVADWQVEVTGTR